MSLRLPALALLLLLVDVADAKELKITQPDADGRLPVSGHPSKMSIKQATPVALGPAKRLAVVTSGDFAVEQLRALKLFDEVISVEDAERIVIARGLTDKVLSLKDGVGQYMFATLYQPYVLVSSHRDVRKGKGAMRWLVSDEYEQFIELRVTDPKTTQVLFSAEIEEDMRWKGVTVKNTYYPLFNELVTWMRASQAQFPAEAAVSAAPPAPPPAPPSPPTMPAPADSRR